MKIPFFDGKIFRFSWPGLAGPPAADLDWSSESSATGRGLWAFGFQRLKMGILEPTGWGLWITLDDQMISNDDIHPLGWISRACLRRWFQAGYTHRLAKGNQPLSLKKSAYPRKGIQPTNSINYHSKMAMFYGQPHWPLKFLLPKEQLDFSSTPQPADWFQVTALGNQKVLTCAGNYRKTQEISPPKR
jgi:hypothetical protein